MSTPPSIFTCSFSSPNGHDYEANVAIIATEEGIRISESVVRLPAPGAPASEKPAAVKMTPSIRFQVYRRLHQAAVGLMHLPLSNEILLEYHGKKDPRSQETSEDSRETGFDPTRIGG